MSFLASNSRLGGAALAAAIGLAAISGTAPPAHADGWIQFGLVAPTFAPPPPPVVVAPPPPPTVYGYAYGYGYGYAYPYAYPTPYAYAVPRYGYGPYYARRWHHWRPVRDRDDWDDD